MKSVNKSPKINRASRGGCKAKGHRDHKKYKIKLFEKGEKGKGMELSRPELS